MNKVILFNPQSARYNFRIPNSILQLGASLEGKFDYVFIDGNMETNPWDTIESYLNTGDYKYFGSTVMPGPQLEQAIHYTKRIKERFAETITIWGGYFPSNQYRSILRSGYVDFIVNGPGDYALPQLLHYFENGKNQNLADIKNLIYLKNGEINKTAKEPIPDQDALPLLPYEKLNKTYPIKNYLKKSFLGTRTIAYHSSFGCPFTCSFCAVVPIYNARWKGKSPIKIYEDIKYLKDNFGGDAIEFHDNNFFVSEKRTVEFAKLIKNEKMSWWGEARIDTLDKYKDESLELMRDSGCRMIFFGAETSSDEVLAKMDKGGTQSVAQMKEFAGRMKKFDIIPEYSFVLGTPAENEEKVWKQINDDINFIKEIKEINPKTEIIIYVYSPVPTEGSDLFEEVKEKGFNFPENLEDWLRPEWLNFDLRKNPLTPWLKPEMVDRIKGFETVLNAYYPTVSDFKLTVFQKRLMRLLSSLRYKKDIFYYPLELKFLQKFWLKYRQPEIEGFYLEN